MTARSLFICVLLASPAWAQEHSFDLKSESVKIVIRNTAATQFSQVKPVQEPKVEREPALVHAFVDGARLVEVPSLRPAAPSPASKKKRPGLASAVFAFLIDEWLGVDDEPDTSPEALYEEWLDCQQKGDDLQTTAQRYETCAGRTRTNTNLPGVPFIYTPPGNVALKN